ncbi:MAG: hypothetical protein JWM34_2431 [Ilumatobacteraceae bacterium]|nr:hypothetical protein [Ilumatobacteraceae bacterium]
MHRPPHRSRLRGRILVAATASIGLLVSSCSSDASTRETTPAPASTSSSAVPAPSAPTVSSAATVTSDSVATTTASSDTASTGSGDTAATGATTVATDVATTEPATTAVPVTAPPVPAGVTLHIGDQLDYLKTVLSLAGQDQNFPYTVDYSAFIGGPPMLQAFQAGAVDAGFIGTTPLIFAQAAGQDLVGIASWHATKGSSYSLVTAPGNTDINGWADLKGKSVAFQKGTAAEAVLLEGLDSVGLKESDITVVDVTSVNVNATLEGGSAQAGIQTEPLTSAYLAADPTAKSVVKAQELTDRSSVLIATKDSLNDAGKSAALADYITRLVKSYGYLKDHQDQVATAVYVKTYGLSPERATQLTTENGPTEFAPVPGDLLAPQQKLADLFAAAGQIPSKIDVSASFDGRFNDLVAATQAAP